MKLYADQAARRTRQSVFDALTVVWVVLWVRAGLAVYHHTTAAESGSRELSAGGTTLNSQMTRAAKAAGGVPIVGDDLRKPFNGAAGAGISMRDAGTSLGNAIETLGRVLGTVTAGLPILLALLVWMALRLPYARRAGRAHRLSRTPAGLDLLALAALHDAPTAALTRIDPEPAAAWRRRDEAAIEGFAAVQLSTLGLTLAPPG